MTNKTITVHGAKLQGMKAALVPIDVTVSDGIGIHIIGLDDANCKECLLRVMTALQSCGYEMPGKKITITITLNPVDLPKAGSFYDLPIALGIIAATGQEDLPYLQRHVFMGELGIDGNLKGELGGVQVQELAAREGFTGAVMPRLTAVMAKESGIPGNIYAAGTLREAVKIARGDADTAPSFLVPQIDFEGFNALSGTERRAIEIAVAGSHNILFASDGSDEGSFRNSLLALHEMMPVLQGEEFLEAARVWSMADSCLSKDEVPQQEVTAGMPLGEIMGTWHKGSFVPGRVSLAHGGILSIPDASMLPKSLLEALRAPLEDGKVTLARLKEKVEYPAKFLLAANVRKARLKQLDEILYYSADMHMLPHAVPGSRAQLWDAAIVARKIIHARGVQKERYAGTAYRANGELKSRDAVTWCKLDAECGKTMDSLLTGLNLTARSYAKILKVARTIADLAGREEIRREDLAEAASYRFLDRKADDSNGQKRP